MEHLDKALAEVVKELSEQLGVGQDFVVEALINQIPAWLIQYWFGLFCGLALIGLAIFCAVRGFRHGEDSHPDACFVDAVIGFFSFAIGCSLVFEAFQVLIQLILNPNYYIIQQVLKQIP